MDTVSIVSVVGGLLVTVLVVGFTAFTFIKIFGGLGKANAERERLLREGIQAGARLMAVQMGSMTMTVGVHRHLQLHLQLEVQMQGRPPYPAMLTTMVSELQIPQLQPGAQLTVRVDPRDGSKLALEGVGGPAPYGGAPPGVYAPGVAPPGAYAPGVYPPGMMMPLGGAPAVPAGAKVGLWLGLGGAAIGILVAVVVVLVNVVGVGLGSASEGDGVCAQAIRCCEISAAGNASAANCKNLGKVGVPTSVCQQSLQSFRESAKARGKTCN